MSGATGDLDVRVQPRVPVPSTRPAGQPSPGSGQAVPRPVLGRAPATVLSGRRRRLTPTAALLMLVGLALLGALLDQVTGHRLHAGAVGLVLGCLVAALRVRREGLGAVVVAPPLVYAGLALLGSLAGGSGVPKTVPRQAVELFTQLVLGAPVLIVATVAAAAVAGVRLVQRR